MAMSINATKVSHALIKAYLNEAEKSMPLPELAKQLCGGDHKRAVLNRALGIMAADLAEAVAAGSRMAKADRIERIASNLPAEAMEPEDDGIPF